MTPVDHVVSAIIPVLNGERFLLSAVESIRRQGHGSLEIVIVDDGSTDGTAAIAKGLGSAVRYVHQPNGGLPNARNTGLAAARGDLLAFLDVDDLWSADKLQNQLSRLESSQGTAIVLGRTQLMIETRDRAGHPSFAHSGEPVLAFSFGAALIRRTAFEIAGSFDETQTYCDDLEWFTRARDMGVSILMTDEVSLYYRRHAKNMSNQLAPGQHGLLSMLKKTLDRRRTVSGGVPEPLRRDPGSGGANERGDQ